MRYAIYILFWSKIFINAYDIKQALICVWLSGASYCDMEDYPNMKLSEYAYGFIYKNTIYDKSTDLQGLIGIIHNEKSIYVSFRGTSSMLNWLSDFEVKQTNYLSYPECNCKIHYGFYRCVMNIREQTINNIIELKKKYTSYNIIITGHSLGAVVAQIFSMELIKLGYEIELYNFGQPRAGNINYALFVNNKIKNYWRFTHNKDIVPHLPPIEDFGYYHSCREVFENQQNKLILCSSDICEDKNCTGQYSLKKTSVNDHYYYLGHRVSCNESTYKLSKRRINEIITTTLLS